MGRRAAILAAGMVFAVGACGDGGGDSGERDPTSGEQDPTLSYQLSAEACEKLQHLDTALSSGERIAEARTAMETVHLGANSPHRPAWEEILHLTTTDTAPDSAAAFNTYDLILRACVEYLSPPPNPQVIVNPEEEHRPPPSGAEIIKAVLDELFD